jgi:hypothetical protein
MVFDQVYTLVAPLLSDLEGYLSSSFPVIGSLLLMAVTKKVIDYIIRR